MDSVFDPGALLARSYQLPRGPRVGLRLLRSADGAAVRDLCARTGIELPELELARLLRFDPRSRIVIAATALAGSRETVVGLGSIDLDAVAPETLIVDAGMTDGLDRLLVRALFGHAGAIARSRAA